MMLTYGEAVKHFKDGALLAYPTESVYGLGCGVMHIDAIERLLMLKKRPKHQGLIVVVSSWSQATTWLASPEDCLTLPSRTDVATTYVFSASDAVPPGLCRMPAQTIAIRCTTFQPLQQLIEACGPLVSTSANLRGCEPCRSDMAVQALFGDTIDGVIMGDVGTANAPSIMMDVQTGQVLRGMQR